MKINIKTLLLFAAKVLLVFFLLSIFTILFFRWVNPATTGFIQRDNNTNLINFLPQDQQQEWISIDEISPKIILAVIAAEDQKFFDHWGFDVEQIKKAIEEIDTGKRIRGASTITQQTAKNLFLWPTKNFVRKGLEAYYTGLIELLWSKKRIIEVYLNIAQFGPGIYGVEAGASYHFNKSANNLNEFEAAYLASILPSPARYPKGRRTNYINKRIRLIREQIKLMGGRQVLDW